MTYEHPLAAMARRAERECATCLYFGSRDGGSTVRPASTGCAYAHNCGVYLRAWTASHVPLDGLPVEVVRAMAERWAQHREDRRAIEWYDLGRSLAAAAQRSEAP